MEQLIGEANVYAAAWWGDTGIELFAGRTYRLEATGQWADADIRCGPDGYNVASLPAWKRPLFSAAGWLRPLNTGDQWYMLLGRVGSDGQVFAIGAGTTFANLISGRLACTVSDVRTMYFNNSGAVLLRVFVTMKDNI